MEKKLFILLFSVFILAIGCTNKNKHISDTNKSATEISIVSTKSDSIESYKRKKMWEEANQYRNSITDTTFLKTKLNKNKYNPNVKSVGLSPHNTLTRKDLVLQNPT